MSMTNKTHNSLNLFHLLSDKARMSGSSPPRTNMQIVTGVTPLRQCVQQRTGKLYLFFAEIIACCSHVTSLLALHIQTKFKYLYSDITYNVDCEAPHV